MDTLIEALPREYRQFRDSLNAFARLVLQSRLFPGTHPCVERALEAACASLDALLERKRSVRFIFMGGVGYYLNFEIDLARERDQAMILLRESLARHAVGEIDIEKGVDRAELAAVARILSHPLSGSTGDLLNIAVGLERIKIRHSFERREIAPDRALVPAGTGLVPAAPAAARRGAGESKIGTAVRGILRNLEKIHSSEGTRAGATIIDVIEREGGGTATILLLNSLREYDDYTFTHSINVAVISAAIARALAFTDEFVDAIVHAALLHDIGKVYVPRAILHKAGRLTPSEWQAMKRHPVDGERILREEGLDLVTRRVAYEHHMRHDLTGYPAPRSGFEAHKASEIVRIADTYDALTTRRPYRSQINPYQAIKLMTRGVGTEFHGDYFSTFLRVLGNVPIGSVLELASGETALVVGIGGGGGELPRVRLLRDAEGKELEEEIVLDLNEIDPKTHQRRWRIARIVDDPVRNVEIGAYLPG